ncbi:hypothetical protein F5Y15DRAFT_325094 [Xylariaceae sp. FL0016]|nr:hypothetical protein F5Y15DRAFT_325094 [Xylariaceae sp. FL0016]
MMTTVGSVPVASALRLWPKSRRKDTAVSSSTLISWILSLSTFFAVSRLLGTTDAQRDPVNDFCRRFGHQSAVIDRKVYIDGGFINFDPIPENPTNYSNTWLAFQDLDQIGQAGMPQLSANLSKNASIPTVDGGVLWADDVNKYFYLFGGEYYQDPPNDLVLYSYDAINNYWEDLGAPSQGIDAVSYGAGVSISETGEAYYYGGWLSNNSVLGWTGPRAATSGLIKYDMDAGVWTNTTGPDSTARAEGAMVYIPASDGGMLIYFGGVEDPGNGTTIGQSMEQIFVYDILSSRWYEQTASGDVPEMRSKFCAGVAWAEDQSSYNIYLYGGRGMPPATAGFDDVYILSIPSFTWIKFYPTDGTNEGRPHNSLTCNVIDNSQMIIIGGTFPLDQDCDAPPQWGSHNLDLGKQNANHAVWNLYDPSITSYAVPDEIYNVIGGNAQGGATKTQPDGGFDEQDLSVLLPRKFTAAARTPKRSVTSSSNGAALSTGAIAGIAVGGAVALIAAVLGCCLFMRRRKKKYQQAPNPVTLVGPYGEMGHNQQWSPYLSPSHHTPASPYAPSTYLSQTHTGQPPMPGHPVELDGMQREVVHAVPISPTASHSHGYPPKYDVGAVGTWPTHTTHSTHSAHPDNVHEILPSPLPGTESQGHSHADGMSFDERQRSDVVARLERYATGGFGPQELATEAQRGTPAPDGGSPGEDRGRHETFYHA